MLLMASENAEIQWKRFGNYDRVEIFKVSWKGKKIRRELGSEPVYEFEESEGLKILDRILDVRKRLETEPFSRDRFFQLLQYGCSLAQREEKELDGWVPVRLFHAYVAPLRRLRSDSFLKDPTPKKCELYWTALFVFDSARFGRTGWICGEYVLRTQTSNMNSVVAKKAVTPPDLGVVYKLGPQFAESRQKDRTLTHRKAISRNATFLDTFPRCLTVSPAVPRFAILFDETENSHHMAKWNVLKRQQHLGNIRNLVDHIATGMFSGCALCFAVVEKFRELAETSLEALAQRIERVHSYQANPRAGWTTLDELTHPSPDQSYFFEILGDKVIELGIAAGVEQSHAQALMKLLAEMAS